MNKIINFYPCLNYSITILYKLINTNPWIWWNRAWEVLVKSLNLMFEAVWEPCLHLIMPYSSLCYVHHIIIVFFFVFFAYFFLKILSQLKHSIYQTLIPAWPERSISSSHGGIMWPSAAPRSHSSRHNEACMNSV